MRESQQKLEKFNRQDDISRDAHLKMKWFVVGSTSTLLVFVFTSAFGFFNLF